MTDLNPRESSKGKGSKRITQGLCKVSFRSLRKALKVARGQSKAAADMTWAEGRRKADERLAGVWQVQGQSYVRLTAEDYGFSAQAAE